MRVSARILAAAVVAAATLTAAPASAAAPGIVCTYKIVWSWSGGFLADLYIANNGPAVTGWNARWSMAHETSNLRGWNAFMTMPTPYEMTAANMGFNAYIPTGRVVSFGWTASALATEVPTDITVNGAPC